MFSSKSFIVSTLTFRSLIHFEFIFVYGVSECSNLILFFFIFGCTMPHVGFQFPYQELNLYYLHWKYGILTTAPPTKEVPLISFFYIQLVISPAPLTEETFSIAHSCLLCHDELTVGVCVYFWASYSAPLLSILFCASTILLLFCLLFL